MKRICSKSVRNLRGLREEEKPRKKKNKGAIREAKGKSGCTDTDVKGGQCFKKDGAVNILNVTEF